jgi:hypothetical protein
MEQGALFDTDRENPNLIRLHSFDGLGLSEADVAALDTQLTAVRELMLDGRWRTLREIRDALPMECDVASVSARLRDLRKTEFGGWSVKRRVRSGRTWEYRVVTGTEA